MYKHFFFAAFSIVFFAVTGFAQMVVYDPSSAFDRNIQAGLDKVHKAFIENKWVENVRIMNQNYNESKRFYDTMMELSKHKGGLAGYYQERAQDRFERAGKDAYGRFESHMRSDPADTAYVKNWMTDMDKKVIAATDFSKEIYALGKESDKSAEEAEKAASKKQLTNEEYESVSLKAAMEQLRQLRLMNKILLQMLERQREQDAKAWAAEKQRQINEEKALTRTTDAWENLKKQKIGPKKDPETVLKELPR